MAEVQQETVQTVEVVKDAPKVEPVKQEPVAHPKPTLKSTFTGIDWTKIDDETEGKLQAEVDRRIAVARDNAARRAKKEAEAFFRGRESVRPAQEPAKQQPAAPAPRMPERQDVDPKTGETYTYEAFLEAKADFIGEQAGSRAVEKREKEAAAKTEQEAEAKRATEFQGKVRAKYPDIDERLADIGDLPIHKGVQEAISESQFGPEILNELVSNPAEFDRLYKLTQTAAIREIGRMEARIEAAQTPVAEASTTPTATVKKPSAVPAPIRPGGGGASPGDGVPRDDMPIDEWMRLERARERKLRA